VSNSMTRQHFKAVANVIAAIKDPDQRRESCYDAIRELRQFNSNFNRSRFEAACGLKEE
jgi:hypothetical protein